MRSVVPVLPVPDVTEAIAWFTSTLGFTEVASFADGPDGPAYGIIHRGDVALHLQSGWTSRGGERSVHEGDAYVYVDDADELLAEFEAAGVELYRPMCDNDYGMRDFCVLTPHGLRIAFGSPLD